jgi:hypothetical protein
VNGEFTCVFGILEHNTYLATVLSIIHISRQSLLPRRPSLLWCQSLL